MSKKAIILAGLASLLASSMVSAPVEAATSKQWWMRDWNCTNTHKQKMQITSKIADDMDCNENGCTVSHDAIAILKWRLVDGAGSVSFRVTAASATSVTATDRPDGGDTELNMIVQFRENGHDRAAGTMTTGGHASDLACTTGSFASLDPLVVKKPGINAGTKKVKPPKSGTIGRKAASDTAIFDEASPRLEIPDIVE